MPTRLCLTVKTFVATGILIRRCGNGHVWEDDGLERWRTCSGLICWSFLTLKEWIIFAIYYVLCGRSMSRPSIVGWIFAISRIRPIVTTLWRGQRLGGVSWCLKVGKLITRIDSGLSSGKAWILSLLSNERNDIYTVVSNECDHERNFVFGDPSPVVFSFLESHSRTSGSTLIENHRRIAKTEIALTRIEPFSERARYRILNHLPIGDIIFARSDDGALIRVFQVWSVRGLL